MNMMNNDIKKAFSIIPDQFKSKVKISLLLSIINGLLDLLSLGMLIPMIIVFIDPKAFSENYLIAKLYSWFGFSSPQAFQLTMIIGTVLVFVFKNILSTFFIHYQNKTSFDIATALSRQLFRSYFNQSYLEFTACNSAIISRKINTVPHDFVVYILTAYLNLITELIIGTAILTIVAIYSPTLLLIIIVSLTPIVLFWKWYNDKHVQRIQREFKDQFPTGLRKLLNGIDSYIDIRTHQKQSFFIDNFIGTKSVMNSNYAFLKTTQLLPPKILEVILIICITIIFAYTSLFQIEQSVIPTLSLFIAAFYRLYPSIAKIIAAATSINSYRFVIDELATDQIINETANEAEITFSQSIQLQNISFHYPDKAPLLRDQSLSIHKGECIGITGESGSGKTTLINLIMGLISPTYGSVKVDNHELNQSTINSWLSQISYLQQQPVIMDASILDNIAFGESNPRLEQVNMAIEQANLTDFIKNLPKGILTQLGEKGLQVSGGQIQRIALARALYRDSEILILDEISNNLDEGNLNDIIADLKNLTNNGKTIIIIDHNSVMLQLVNTIWNVVEGKITVLESAPLIK